MGLVGGLLCVPELVCFNAVADEGVGQEEKQRGGRTSLKKYENMDKNLGDNILYFCLFTKYVLLWVDG